VKIESSVVWRTGVAHLKMTENTMVFGLTRALTKNLKATDERCADSSYHPTAKLVDANGNPIKSIRSGYEQAHHVIPLNYDGMNDVHQIMAACDIDIDLPDNGACMDTPSHNQTKTYQKDNPDAYIMQILDKFKKSNVEKPDGSIDCDKVRDKLSKIKQHLKEQNLISQSGNAFKVDLGGLGL